VIDLHAMFPNSPGMTFEDAAPAAVTPAAETPKSAPAPTPDGERAAAMFTHETSQTPEVQVDVIEARQSNVPDAVREHREADAERRMYPDDGLYFKDELKPGDDSPEQAAEVLEWKGIARDVGATPQQVAELKDVLGRELAEGLPTPEKREQWAAESVETLQRKYGDELPALLADANKMIARDPRLAAWLEHSGLGNRVEFVAHAIELARQQRQAGRLK